MLGRIQRRADLDRLRTDGSSVRSGRLRVTMCPGNGEVAVAFAIPRAYGTAVRRNRARRRLREIIREGLRTGEVIPGTYLIQLRPGPDELDHATLAGLWSDAQHRLRDTGVVR